MKCGCEKTVQQQSLRFIELAKSNNVAKLSDGANLNSLVPFTMVLQPFVITQQQFQKLKKYSSLWQKLTHLASLDPQLIISSLGNLKEDPMVGPMLSIYEKIVLKSKESKKTFHQPKIELFRTDFFITDDAQTNIKLIQYNNMSVSMAGVSQKYQITQQEFWGGKKKIINNTSTQTFAKGLANFYTKSGLSGVMLAVVKDKQTNIVDQDLLFGQIKKHIDVQIIRVVIENLGKQTNVSENGDLLYHGKKVSVVYYRAGYSSSEHIDWSAVEKCNLSSAVNIPSISSFLIGTKKMQAVLSRKQIMMKYLTEEESIFLMQSVIDTWGFDQEESKQKILQMIEKDGVEEFVLKPNEEGGKNNFFGIDAYKKIKDLSKKELKNYILTRKIYSRKQQCNLLNCNDWKCCSVKPVKVENEISIYGCVCSGCQCKETYGECKCSEGGCCMVNCCEGYLVRSKPEGVNEGGLMAGTGAICGLQLRQK